MTNLPEGLTLCLDESELRIEDAQGVVHVRFGVGPGDPVEWGRTIALRTCEALGVHRTCDYNDPEDPRLRVDELLDRWHVQNCAHDGFLP